ncbi:ATP-binding cassette sub-family A member 17 isoform 2-T2 [Glossina fuscipes fuscipes]
MKAFKLLLKKNFISDVRSWIWLLFEILVFMLCLLYSVINPLQEVRRHEMDSKLVPDDKNKIHMYKGLVPLDDLNYTRGLIKGNMPDTLFYTPENAFTKKLLNAVIKILGLKSIKGFKDEMNLQSNFDDKKAFAGIVFYNTSDDIPQRLSMSIRFPSELRTVHSDAPIYQNYWVTRCTGFLTDEETKGKGLKHVSLYQREGFLQLQQCLFLQWLRLRDIDSEKKIKIVYGSLLYPSDIYYCEFSDTPNFRWFCYYMTFVITYLSLVCKYSKEVQENIFSYHWTYKVQNGHHWWAHFIVSFVHVMILVIIVTISFAIKWAVEPEFKFGYVPPLLFFVFMVLYGIALILTAMITTAIFRNAKTAIVFSVTIWIGTYALLAIAIDVESRPTIGVLICFAVFFNNMYPYTVDFLSGYKTVEFHDLLIIMLFPIGYIIVLLLLLSLFDYILLHQDRDKTGFSIIGIPYLCRKKSKRARKPDPINPRAYPLNRQNSSWLNYEFGAYNLSIMLSLKNVFTFFDDHKVYPHLKDVTMRIFKNEISIILGSNNTGKTTLLKVLAGWIKYSGSIYFDGAHEVCENLDYYQQYVDICMSHCPLFDMLTVKETLSYFALIKQKVPNLEQTNLEVYKWLDRLKPAAIKEHWYVKRLSYANKRLLALCCALCNNTTIVLLDEPTVNMRSFEQSLYWHILQKEKPDRAIIVTTDSVDEAEHLGDRIGVLSDGYLMAWGTPIFLKSHFAKDYSLVLLRDTSKPLRPILDLLRTYISNIVITNQIGDKVVFKMPAEKRPEYQKMLIALEDNASEYGIRNITVVSGEMGDVFMNLSLESELQQNLPDLRRILHRNEPVSQNSKNQVKAMLYKKWISTAPNIMPIIIIFVAIVVILLINELTKSVQPISNIERGGMMGFRLYEPTRKIVDNISTDCEHVEIRDLQQGSMTSKFSITHHSYIFKTFRCAKERFHDIMEYSSYKFNQKGAVQIIGNEFTVWASQNIFHTAPVTLNLAQNMMLRKLYPDKPEIITTIINNPIPMSMSAKFSVMESQIVSLRIPLTLGIIMPLSVSSFIFCLAEELNNGFFTLQKMAGLRLITFWIINFAWDFVTLLIYCILYFIVMIFSTIEGFPLSGKLATFLLMCLHNAPALFTVYLTALFVGGNKTRSFLIATIVQLVAGLLSFVVYWDVTCHNSVILYLSMIFPTFALLQGASNIYMLSKERQYCTRRCEGITNCTSVNMCELMQNCCFGSLFKWHTPGILMSLVYMILSAFLYAFLIWLYYYLQHNPKFRVPPRQKCFAIYGSRNSGKTHIIKQLVGEKRFFYGEIYICKVNTKRKIKDAYVHMGYCPESKGLISAFTPRQLLTLLFRIRGLPQKVITEKIREISISLCLQGLINKKIGQLPRSIRRRVSIAIAFMANSNVLILDEPTRGLPAIEKRLIWNVLRYLRYCGNSIIFATTDSHECDVLADTVLVVDDGVMLAIGSAHYLRQKFTVGFYLDIKLRLDGSTDEETDKNLKIDLENVSRFISFLHSSSELIKVNSNVLIYYVPVEDVSYSYLFGSLEKNRRRLNISEYSVCHGSLTNGMENILKARLEKRKFSKST